MKQLKLALPHKPFETLINTAKSVVAYIRKHPDDVMLAVMLVMLMEIDADIEDLEGPST
jgi:hypothetical protein